MNQKVQELRNKLKGLELDGMIVSNPVNIRYLTNIQAEGTLLITRKENIYLTDSRYVEAVNSTLTIDDEIMVYDVRGLRQEDYENLFLFCKDIGFEEDYVTYTRYKDLIRIYKLENLVETENLIEQMRTVKDEEEIKKIRKACEMTDICFKHLLKYIKKGMTEKEIAVEIERFFKLNGAEDVSFSPIVASGKNSAMPHAIPTDKKIESGDVITIDMGCKYQGYCSDMTRTIFIDTVSEEVKTVYDLVLKNQLQVLREFKDGESIKNISKRVEDRFEENNQLVMHALRTRSGIRTA